MLIYIFELYLEITWKFMCFQWYNFMVLTYTAMEIECSKSDDVIVAIILKKKFFFAKYWT